MPDEPDNKSDMKNQSEISQSKTPTPKSMPQEELQQKAKQSIKEPVAKIPAKSALIEEEKPKRRFGKAAQATDETKPALKIEESVDDRKSLLKPENRDAEPILKPKEEPIKLTVPQQPKDEEKSKNLKQPESKAVESTKDIIMAEASVVPIPEPVRRPSLRNKYDPMKFIPSEEVEACIVESNLETIYDAKHDAEVNTKVL